MPKRWVALFGVAAAACVLAASLFFAIVLGVAYSRPPQPLPLGTVQWDYETGFTVASVDRVGAIRYDGRTYRAHGEFYLVRARVFCPYGERFHWSDRDVAVETFSGSGGAQPDQARFSVDEPVQAILDRQTHRPGPQHTILGATQREDLVFDLPKDVEQPALVFLAANDPLDVIDGLREGSIWQPHRFNIRYD
jgi:hypothetical protein